MEQAKGLRQYVYPSDADKYVIEGSVHHLTWDIIAWIGSVSPTWKLVRIRYEWEKLIEKSRGKSMFLELTYAPSQEHLIFPYMLFYCYPVYNWFVFFVDFVEYSQVKVIIRMVHKDDLKIRRRKKK